MAYCDRDNLLDRLSEAGLVFVASDRNGDSASEADRTRSLDRAIAAAGTEIDAALVAVVRLPVAEGNAWLRERAVELSLEHLAARRGGQVPPSIAQAAARARTWLDPVRLGKLRVPGLVYPADSAAPRVGPPGLPRVANPG